MALLDGSLDDSSLIPGMIGLALMKAGQSNNNNNQNNNGLLNAMILSNMISDPFSGTNPSYQLNNVPGITNNPNLSTGNMNGFDPKLAGMLPGILSDLRAKGWEPYIASGLRTPDEQRQKVAQGYSQTMNSKHLVGKAADIVDQRYGWDGNQAQQFFHDLGQAAQAHGATWGGNWKSFPDPAHIQVSMLTNTTRNDPSTGQDFGYQMPLVSPNQTGPNTSYPMRQNQGDYHFDSSPKSLLANLIKQNQQIPTSYFA